MGTEIDPFIAGLPFGALVGAAPLLTPRLSASFVALVLAWMIYLLRTDGLTGLEYVAQSLVQELTLHGRLVLGMSVGTVLSFSALRSLLNKDCA